MNNKTLDSLKIFNRNKTTKVNSNEQTIRKTIKDFEFSETWKQKAYQAVIVYMQKRIKKVDENCRIVSRGTYNSNYVQYVGGQTYSIKYYCEFDCNQNHINQSYFYIDATYLGNNNWDLKVTDRRLTH